MKFVDDDDYDDDDDDYDDDDDDDDDDDFGIFLPHSAHSTSEPMGFWVPGTNPLTVSSQGGYRIAS